MDNLFDRLNASTESVRSHRDILNGYPLKFQDVSDDKRAEWEKTHSDANVDKQDGGKETSMQKASETKEERPPPFVIPKKKRRTTDVLLDVKVSSRDFQHEILPAITKSYRQPQSNSRFVYDQVQFVQNTYLTDAYMEKRRELRGCGYVDKELSDSFAFLCMDIENEEETNKICREGLHVGNSVDSCLGHPQMGVHLCKHADVLKPVGLNSGYSGHLVVFKVMKGKIKSVMENRSGSHLEPTPNYDCHLSSTTGNDLSSLNQQNLYESTQLYLYEYGDESVIDVPRNVCPVALIRFTYNESQKDVKSPDMSSPKFSMRSPLSVKPIPSSPQIKGEDQNFVVWTGHLTVKGLYACSVEMTSKAGPAKPSRIGKGINVTHKMPIAQARKKYLQRVTAIDRHHEGYWNGYYVNVCELHPVKPEGKSHFQKVMNYLGKHNCVAIRKLEKDVVLLLLTASELTFQLGLTKPHQYPVILYSVFLSRTSRKHGAVQTDPLVHPALTMAPVGLPTSVSSDPHLREKTKPLQIRLPPSPSLLHQGLSDNTKHSTVASPSHSYPSLIYAQMPPPPSPTKGVRSTTRGSPVVGMAPARWAVSSPPPALILPAFCPSQPPPPLTPPVMAPTSPLQGLGSPVHAPLSPLNHWALIPPPPPPPPITPGITPVSPHFSQSMDIVQSLYSPITSPVTSPMPCSPSLQYCLPQTRPVHSSGVYMGAVGQPNSPRDHRDPRDHARDPRESRDPRHARDFPRSPREHARDPRPGSGYMSPLSVHHDPALDGGKSPASPGPLTSSPQHPTQPPPKLQTPPPPSSRHELEGTHFESPRHFSSYPPKTSLLFTDQIKSEFTKQAKTLESIAHRNKSRPVTSQSNGLFSMSSDSESEMSDSEMNRIVKRICVPTDESMDTENSSKASPTKPLPEVSCIEEVMDMKELLNKSLEKPTEKKTEKQKDLQKQEAEAMRQLLNSAVCDQNLQQKGKVAAECKQKQTTFSVKPLPSKNTLEKKVSKTCIDKTIPSKVDKLNSKKPREPSRSLSESTRQSGSKEREQNSRSLSESTRQNGSKEREQNSRPQSESTRRSGSKEQEQKCNSQKESTRQSGSKEREQKPVLCKKSISINENNPASSSQKQTSILKTYDKKCSKSQQEAGSSIAANHGKILEKTKEQKSNKSRSRTSSTSSQSGHSTNDEKKSVGKSTAHKSSNYIEQSDRKPERLQTSSEKYDASCSNKLQQKNDHKTSSKHKTLTLSSKSIPVIATKMDKSFPVMASKSQTKTLHPDQPSKAKTSSNKARARAYSSSEIENSLGVSDEHVNSAPKKAKLDPAMNVDKSSLWNKVNSAASKKTVPVIGEKKQTNEKKLSFKIKAPKSLLQKDPLSVNKGGKRGLKCGKSSSSSSSSAKRTDAVKEKRKIKSWVDTNREKCSIEDVLPGLYSADKSKLGRIPKLSKIPKKGQKSSETDTASTISSQSTSKFISGQSSAGINTSSVLQSSSGVGISPALQSSDVNISPAVQSSDVNVSPAVQSSDVNISPAVQSSDVNNSPAVQSDVEMSPSLQICDVNISPAVKPSPVNNSPAAKPFDVEMSSSLQICDVNITPAIQPYDVDMLPAVQSSDVNLSSPATRESVHDAKTMLAVTRLSSDVEKTSLDGVKHVDDEDQNTRKLTGTLTEGSKLSNATDLAETRTSPEICSEDDSSSNLISQQTRSKDESKCADKEYERDHYNNQDLMEEPKDVPSNRSMSEPNVMLNHVPELHFLDQSSQKSSYGSSCCSSRNSSVERDSYTAPEKRRKHLRKRDKAESPLDNIMKSIRNSAAAKLRSSPQGWSDRERSPGFSSDSERSNDAMKPLTGFKGKSNVDMEKRLQKKYNKDHSNPVKMKSSTDVPEFDNLPLVDLDSMISGSANRMCNITSMENTAEATWFKRQPAKRDRSHSTERVTPVLDDLPLTDPDTEFGPSKILRLAENGESLSAVKDSRTQSSKRERSITPEIVIPGLGDLPLSEINPDCRSSNVVFDPLRLAETAGFSDKKITTPSAKRERSITPEIVIPGLGDLPLKDLYGDSQTSNIVFDPLKLTNTPGHARKETTTSAKRERSITPEIVIPGLGDLPFPDKDSCIINRTETTNATGVKHLKMEMITDDVAKLDGVPSTTPTRDLTKVVPCPSRSAFSAGVLCDQASNTTTVDTLISEESSPHLACSSDDVSSVFIPIKPSEDTSSVTSTAKDDKPVATRSEETVQGLDADDGELVLNSTRMIERAGRELKLRITVPNNLCGDAAVKLVTLDQTIRLTLHGHRQFSRLTASESVLMTTINRVIHKKLVEGQDQRQVEDFNGKKKDAVLTKKSSNSPSMEELTRNLSPSLVEFARKHLSPSVTDFTRKHDPDLDSEPSDHISDFVSYEGWGSNRNTDNLSSSTKADKRCSETNNSASSTEKSSVGELKPSLPGTTSSTSNMKYVPASAFVPKKGSLVGKTFMDKTRAVSADALSSDLPTDNLTSRSPTATISSDYFSGLSDSTTTIRTITSVPKKDSSSTVEGEISDKIQMKSKTHSVASEKSCSETANCESNEASDSIRVENLLTAIESNSENLKTEKCVNKNSSAIITNVSNVLASPLPETVSSSLLSTQTSETASSLPSTKSSETASSSLTSTKSSETVSSLPSTKSSETVSSSLPCTKSSETVSSLPSTKSSETVSSSLPCTKTSETASSSLKSTKLSESASSSLPSTKSSETASSSLKSTKSSESASSSRPSTKTSKNTTKPSETASPQLLSTSEGLALLSPIRLPGGNKPETISKTLVPESAKSSQVGAMRSDNQTSRKERKAQTHPYTRRRRRDSWSFDIPYRNLQELMRDLTTDTFKQNNVTVPKPQKSKGRVPCRFRNYRFRRSSVPDCLPDSPDDSDEFTSEAIPDFEERKRKADILETMQTNKKEDQEDYNAEQSSYSPGATQTVKGKPGGDADKEVDSEKENIHARLLRISKMTSPAQINPSGDKDTPSQGSSKDKTSHGSSKDTVSQGSSKDKTSQGSSKDKTSQGSSKDKTSQGSSKDKTSQGSSKDKTTLDKIQSENGFDSSNSRKRRISQACSPSRRRDWRQSRSRHNTGLGETKHSQQIQDDTSSKCSSKENTPTDNKGGKSPQTSSRGSTPSDLTLLRQGSREYSPSEFFSGTSEGKSSRENTPTDFTQDTDISGTSHFVLSFPKVEETLKRKIRIKRLDSSSEKGSSLSPVAVKSDDCNNPSMFRPITTHNPTDSIEKEEGDLRNYIQQLKKEKEEFGCSEKLESDKGSRSDSNGPTDAPESNQNNKRITDCTQKISEESPIAGDTENTMNNGNISDEDMSDWIVMDEFQCQDVSGLKEPGGHHDKPDGLEHKPDNQNQLAKNIAEEPLTNVAKDGTEDDVRRDVSSYLAQVRSELRTKESLSDDQDQLAKNIAEEPLTNVAKDGSEDDVRRDVSRYLAQVRSELQTTGTEEKESLTDDQDQLAKNIAEEPLTNRANDSTEDFVRRDVSRYLAQVWSELQMTGTEEKKSLSDYEDQLTKNIIQEPLANSDIHGTEDDVRRDVSRYLAQVRSELQTTRTEEKKSLCDDQDQLAKNIAEEPLANSAKDGTDDDVRKRVSRDPTQVPSELLMTGTEGKNLPTVNGNSLNCNGSDSLCTSAHTKINDDTRSEINQGDKTIIEISDMSISEISNDHQDADIFVPVIYLSGTKGRKIPWAKELEQSEVTEVNNAKIIDRNSVLQELDKLTNKDVNKDITFTDLSGRKGDVSLTLELNKTTSTEVIAKQEYNANNNSRQSAVVLELKEEDGPVLNQTSEGSTRELVNQMSEDDGVEGKIKEEIQLNVKSTFEEMLKQNSSKTSKPENLQGTNNHTTSSTNGCNVNEQITGETNNEDTRGNEINTENMEKTNVDGTQGDASEDQMKESVVDVVVTCNSTDQQTVATSRIYNKHSLYGYEEENPANTSVTATRLDCSWDYTVNLDENSSEPIYGEYYTAASRQVLDNSKYDDSPVYKELTNRSLVQTEQSSDTSCSSGSCDTPGQDEKPTTDSVNSDCGENLQDMGYNLTAIHNPAASSNHTSEINTTYKLDTHQTKACDILQGEPVKCPEESEVVVEQTVASVGTEEETIPCIGAEEETVTCVEAEEELLLATNTCALLCHGEVFTSVTGRDETSSSGQESSQDSSNQCSNLSFEEEYRENSERELFELGEYCADLNYRLDRDMDLGHDCEVESLISRLEEGKDDNDDLIPCKQFEALDKNHNVSMEKHHWKALQSKLKLEGDEKFNEQKDSCTEFATRKLKLQGLNNDKVNEKTTSSIDVYECFDKDDVALNSNYTCVDGTSLETLRKSPEKVLQSSNDQNIELNADPKTLPPETFTGYSQEEAGHDDTKGYVSISGREEFVPDSQEESDGDEAVMVNISDFLKSDVLQDCNPGITLDKHPTGSPTIHQNSVTVKSKIIEETAQVQPPVKISTPRVSPVADFFGLQCETPVMPSADRHCTDYVYGMYKNTPEPASEIPVESNVEDTYQHESDSSIWAKLPSFVQNSPLNLSVSSKTKTNEGIPGMKGYESPDCSDLADEEVTSHCGTNIQQVSSIQGAAINTDASSNFELPPPLTVSSEESCPVEITPTLSLTGESEEQNEMSTDISNLPEETSLSTESEAPTLQPVVDKTVSPEAEDSQPQPTLSSDSDCFIASSQDNDSDECSQESVPAQDLDAVVQSQSSVKCSIVEGQTSNPTAASPEVDVQQPQPVLAAEVSSCEDSRPCTPMNYGSPQPWVISPPPYVPNFWPYSPPLGYPPNAHFPYRPPLLQHPLHNYNMWRPPFFHYPDHRSIPLQQHGIMSSLDPRILSWTGAVRQQLQASGLCPFPMFENRLPLYSSYTYSRSDTNVGGHQRGKTNGDPANAVYPSSPPDQGGNLPNYSNVFMQYVVHKRPVLTNAAVLTSPPAARSQHSVSLTTTPLMTTPPPTGHLPMVKSPSAFTPHPTGHLPVVESPFAFTPHPTAHLPMVESPSAFTPHPTGHLPVVESPSAFTPHPTAHLPVVESPSVLSLTPTGPTASKVTRNLCSISVNSSKCTTTDCLIDPENIPLPDDSPNNSQNLETPAILPPISTFTRKPDVDRKSDESHNLVCGPEQDLC